MRPSLYKLAGKIRAGIFVLTAPSGGGKTTLVKFMRRRFKDIIYSISTTTRRPRHSEKDGVDYNFVTESVFRRQIREKKFAEWAKVHGFYYGTSAKNIKSALKNGRSIVLDLDVKGAKSVKKMFPWANIIFITASSIKELEKRLRARGQDEQATIRRRMQDARVELKEIKNFDYLVINDDIKKAEKEISAIYIANSCRIRI
ncbi:MAG: guanylate kinase [bacterium]